MHHVSRGVGPWSTLFDEGNCQQEKHKWALWAPKQGSKEAILRGRGLFTALPMMLTFIIPIKVKTLTAEILQLFSIWPPMLSPSERVTDNSSELLRRICWVSSPHDNLQGRYFYFIFQIRKLKLRNTCWKSASHSYSLDKPLSLLSTPEFLLHIRKWTHDLLYLRFTDPSGFSGLTSVLRHSRTWPGSGAFWRFLLAFVSLIKPYLHLFPVYRGTGRTCAFLARGQLPQAICCLSVTWFDSTQTPRAVNPQESVKKRAKENAETGLNQDSSALVQSVHGCHGNRISLSFHLAPPTDLLAASGDQGNPHRTASVLSSAWLYFYTTEFYTLLSLDHKIEMKNKKQNTHRFFDHGFPLIKCNETIPCFLFLKLYISSSLWAHPQPTHAHKYTLTPFQCLLAKFLKKYSDQRNSKLIEMGS